MTHVIKSTPADRAVDYHMAALHLRRAAEDLRYALSLTKHHGASISYGEAVAESIEEWASEAGKQAEVSLTRARTRK